MSGRVPQDEMFTSAMAEFGSVIGRLVRGYEYDRTQQDELSQEIQIALWRSFVIFDGRCSLRTWVFRIAHNTAVAHIARSRRRKAVRWITLDELAELPQGADAEAAVGEPMMLEQLYDAIRRLRPPDAQIMLLWLEGEEASAISEITGLSPSAVATRVHRVKAALARQFRQGGQAHA